MSSRIHIPQELQTTPESQIAGAATMLGLELSPERIEHIAELANSIFTHDRHDIAGIYNEQGLVIKPVLRASTTEFSVVPAAWVDFIPKLPGDDRGTETPRREEATRISLMGIDAFQNYILLTEAGLIKPPKGFIGGTNPTMAMVSRRIGFKSEPNNERIIRAPYGVVAERIFSPEILKIQHILERRQLASIAAASLALGK